uniref:Uncharacterized protein n=1 Tax=Fagus sylvatica TaxID=28930 RepID=A0A2N9HU70_FAGSY
MVGSTLLRQQPWPWWLFLIVGFVFYYGLNGCGGFVVMGCWHGGKTGVDMGCRCDFAGWRGGKTGVGMGYRCGFAGWCGGKTGVGMGYQSPALQTRRVTVPLPGPKLNGKVCESEFKSGSNLHIVWAESKRERSREHLEERERKWGEMKERVGPITVINWDPHEFNPDLNPDWIQKRAKG